MGHIGRVISVENAEVKVDLGGGEVLTARIMKDPGVDALPVVGDYVSALNIIGSGLDVVVGWTDKADNETAGPGEYRVYGRTASGEVVNTIYLNSDGSVIISNTRGDITLGSDGDVSISNNLKVGGIIEAAAVEAPSVKANNKELAEHTHNFINADGNPSTTLVNNP